MIPRLRARDAIYPRANENFRFRLETAMFLIFSLALVSINYSAYNFDLNGKFFGSLH